VKLCGSTAWHMLDDDHRLVGEHLIRLRP